MVFGIQDTIRLDTSMPASCCTKFSADADAVNFSVEQVGRDFISTSSPRRIRGG